MSVIKPMVLIREKARCLGDNPIDISVARTVETAGTRLGGR